jgi:predicted MPP superfamily phosphohydrolase
LSSATLEGLAPRRSSPSVPTHSAGAGLRNLVRTFPFQVLLFTALLLWRLEKRAVPSLWRRVVLGVGAAIALLAVPHAVFGWQVQQHLPLLYLRMEVGLVACWLCVTIGVGSALWVTDLLARGISLPVNASRRALFARAPLALAVAAPVGVLGGESEPTLRRVQVDCPELPLALDGFRILQISDLHLGPCLGLDWLERALARASGERIDLVAVTGDLSDDLELIGPALRLIAAVPARFGHVAIPGNHEHYVGIDRFNREVRASPVRLLTGQTLTLDRDATPLQLLGIDFPTQLGKAHLVFGALLDPVLARTPPGFRLLLSHHPDAFDVAATRGIGFTLSGHTHGGQLAVLGHSLLGWALRYPKGTFARGQSRLFVTTGLGHWLPFRIGCPTELPLIELHRA